jgi:sulfite reductase alpha subunit-like flavoprotein
VRSFATRWHHPIDDLSHSIDTALEPWLKGLFDALLFHFPLPRGLSIIPSDVRPRPRLSIRPATQAANGVNGVHQSPIRTVQATLTRKERVTAGDHFQDTRHISFALGEDVRCVSVLVLCSVSATNAAHRWEPGDVLELRPENDPDEVDAFLTMLKWRERADEPFYMSAASEGPPRSYRIRPLHK